MEELRDKLLDWAKQFETPDFIKDDPIFFPHKYNDKKDIEISAFLTSWIAFGNRKLIMQQAEILDNLMGNSPYRTEMKKILIICVLFALIAGCASPRNSVENHPAKNSPQPDALPDNKENRFTKQFQQADSMFNQKYLLE